MGCSGDGIANSPCDKIPRMDFSKITDDLFIGTTPFVRDYNHLRELGVRLVINMRFTHYPGQMIMFNRSAFCR